MTRLGWCIAGQHIGVAPISPKGSRCPGRAWNLMCECSCHTDPVAIAADAALGPNYDPPKSAAFDVGGRFGPPLPKQPLKLQRRKKKK